MPDTPRTVREVTDHIRGLFDSDPMLGDLWITGEVIESSVTRSGHIFFTLAGEDAQIRCVLFRLNALRQKTLPSPGSACIAHGRVEVYSTDGTYQFYVDLVEEAGIGLAALELELLRQQLEAEGLFSVSRKRPLPGNPAFIGVVTSAAGAVWHDIQNVVRRRFPFTSLILAPSMVQGESAPAALVDALQSLILDGRSQVIVIARGGGSVSDLAAFNDENLLRAAFASPVPIVSAIGHETDWSLLDLVADVRAPTPSAAAELMTPAIDGELTAIREVLFRHIAHIERELSTLTLDIDRLTTRLDRIGPGAALPPAHAQLMSAQAELTSVVLHRIDSRRLDLHMVSHKLRETILLRGQKQVARVSRANELLRALSPTEIMARGYASVENRETGRPVRSATEVSAGEILRSHFFDGSIESAVSNVTLGTP